MKIDIKKYLDKIAHFDNLEKIKEIDEQYLESLINDFKLSNLEVKVLNDISKGLDNDHIRRRHNLTPAKIDELTQSLYSKLGVESFTKNAS